MSATKSRMQLRARAVGPWQTNAYVLLCPATRRSVLIDPAGEPSTLLEMLADSDPVGILLTHSHIDHIGALEAVRARLKVPLIAHPGSGGRGLGTDRWVRDGDVVEVGEHALKVHHTPGHTEDMICFAVVDDNPVIVGDTIFEGGPGKSFSREGFRTTLRTLRDVVLSWPDDTVCYPGHGASFRLGDKRTAIEGFLRKDHGDFYGDATWEM